MSVKKFNEFLRDIDVALYRGKYRHIKLVELDMPRPVQAIRHIYREYWEKRRDFPDYENFYAMYSGELKKEIEKFRVETMFSKETFYRGLPARIYRTWASLLTQIQGGYAAEKIYGKGKVRMSAELDYQGIDMRIQHGGQVIDVQIKKESLSREVRAPWRNMKKSVTVIMLTYEVPGCSQYTKTGKESVPFKRWEEKWRGKLDVLPNDFVVFLPDMFSPEHITVP